MESVCGLMFCVCFPLRSLSRVASDNSSDSVVCIGILRPLRPLREIKWHILTASNGDDNFVDIGGNGEWDYTLAEPLSAVRRTVDSG